MAALQMRMRMIKNMYPSVLKNNAEAVKTIKDDTPLVGGSGSDDFVFVGGDLDGQLNTITDFESGADRIVLADLLLALGMAATDDPGEWAFLRTEGSNTFVDIDRDGSGPLGVIPLIVTTDAAIDAADLVNF